jgi:hypothetical protein
MESAFGSRPGNFVLSVSNSGYHGIRVRSLAGLFCLRPPEWDQSTIPPIIRCTAMLYHYLTLDGVIFSLSRHIVFSTCFLAIAGSGTRYFLLFT